MTSVLDASALLAYLQEEPGSEAIAATLRAGALMSTVNWAEVTQKAHAASVDVAGLSSDLVALGIEFVPFTRSQAEIAGSLWNQTKSFTLSLGDRSCLALGLEQGATVYTADRVWTKLDLGILVESIR